MEKKIVIIGAGISGLVAARELELSGYKPLMIERTGEIGGRVKTDEKEGFLLDHGFQVLLTAYPEARRYLDYEELNLKRFNPGAIIHKGREWMTFSDPLRKPSYLFTMLFSHIGSLRDKWKIFRLQQRLKGVDNEDIFQEEEITTLEYLKRHGFSEAIIQNFFRPFFSGIFLENGLETSSRMFAFVFKMFAEGSAAIPAKGMQAIPKQLAGNLERTQIKFNTSVTELRPNILLTSSGEEIPYDRLITSIHPSHLLPTMAKGAYRKVSCLYFECDERLFNEKLIMLNAGEGWINNMHYADAVADSYSKKGHLLSVSVVKPHEEKQIQELVEKELQDNFNINGRFIDLFTINEALPVIESMAYTLQPEATRINEAIFMCGDQLLYPSLNAAMHSGRLAAQAVHKSYSPKL